MHFPNFSLPLPNSHRITSAYQLVPGRDVSQNRCARANNCTLSNTYSLDDVRTGPDVSPLTQHYRSAQNSGRRYVTMRAYPAIMIQAGSRINDRIESDNHVCLQHYPGHYLHTSLEFDPISNNGGRMYQSRKRISLCS